MSLKCQWFSPMAKKLRPRVKICGPVGLTALPPSDKKHPPPMASPMASTAIPAADGLTE